MRRVGVPLTSLTLAFAACNVLTGVTGLHPCDKSTCGDHSVWTGTNTVGGTFEGNACSDWTSSDVMNKGARGNGGGNGNGWSASGEDVCSSTGRLYCFEK